jgi:hypothetical protein
MSRIHVDFCTEVRRGAKHHERVGALIRPEPVCVTHVSLPKGDQKPPQTAKTTASRFPPDVRGWKQCCMTPWRWPWPALLQSRLPWAHHDLAAPIDVYSHPVVAVANWTLGDERGRTARQRSTFPAELEVEWRRTRCAAALLGMTGFAASLTPRERNHDQP